MIQRTLVLYCLSNMKLLIGSNDLNVLNYNKFLRIFPHFTALFIFAIFKESVVAESILDSLETVNSADTEPSSRIVGGSATSQHEYPSLVALLDQPSKAHVCDGTISKWKNK